MDGLTTNPDFSSVEKRLTTAQKSPVSAAPTGFTPLTPEQYQKARQSGFSHDQIIQNEQRRKSESPQTPSAPKDDRGLFQKGFESIFPIVPDLRADLQGASAGAPQKTGLQQVGDAALSALPFIPGLGEAGAVAKGGMLAKLAANPVARNAAIGYGSGVAANLSQGQGAGQALMPNINTVGGAVVGGGTAGLLKGLTGGAQGLRNSSVKNMETILAPTGKIDKQLTQKIAPELAKKGVIAATRDSLLAKYEEHMGAAGDALDAGYEKLPANAKFEVGSLFDTLNKKIDRLTINGVVPSAAQPKVQAYQTLMKDLAHLGVSVSEDGTQVFSDVSNVRTLRQILDSGKKTFALTDLDAATKGAQKELGASIRSEFAKQYPDISKLNKDFNFWSNAVSVLSNTVERKTGQSGVVHKGIEAGLGAMGGMPMGHPIIGAAVMRGLAGLVHSPAWGATSALVKNSIADALEKGDAAGANKIIQGLMKRSPSVGSAGFQGLMGQIIPQR